MFASHFSPLWILLFCSQVARVVIAISIDRGIHCGDQQGLVLMNSVQKCQNARLFTFTYWWIYTVIAFTTYYDISYEYTCIFIYIYWIYSMCAVWDLKKQRHTLPIISYHYIWYNGFVSFAKVSSTVESLDLLSLRPTSPIRRGCWTAKSGGWLWWLAVRRVLFQVHVYGCFQK